ncbi:hypothetical protein M3Y99_01866800 [Aphelenchoides fujianensis]|nr:hypothetical protein M3Y99_01866800 [Aphelenchoides fujianensis]
MANWLCTRPGEKTPCFKFYFDIDLWRANFTQDKLMEFGKSCCHEAGCAISDIKKHCCLEPRCTRFCYATDEKAASK